MFYRVPSYRKLKKKYLIGGVIVGVRYECTRTPITVHTVVQRSSIREICSRRSNGTAKQRVRIIPFTIVPSTF